MRMASRGRKGEGRGDVARAHCLDGGGVGPGVDIDTVEGKRNACGVDMAHADSRLRPMETEDAKAWTRRAKFTRATSWEAAKGKTANSPSRFHVRC
uniref:Uncharacterized protein n=1 Tax=Oryza glumipatula TaxID=40148 RepID=A0A0E0BIH4_9ORYZ